MVMARKKEKKEKDIIGQLLDNIDFRFSTIRLFRCTRLG